MHCIGLKLTCHPVYLILLLLASRLHHPHLVLAESGRLGQRSAASPARTRVRPEAQVVLATLLLRHKCASSGKRRKFGHFLLVIRAVKVLFQKNFVQFSSSFAPRTAH